MNFAYLPQTVQLPDEPRYLLRNRKSFLKFMLYVGFSVIFIVVIYLDRASQATIEPLLVGGGISAIAYCWYLTPYLEVTPTGLRAVNAFSTREIHWEIFRNVDTRFGLVVTSQADFADPAKLTADTDIDPRVSANGEVHAETVASVDPKQLHLRKPRKHQDLVGAFPNRAKKLGKDRAVLWDQTGVHELRVTVSELPELIYGMRELHRKQTNPKDVYLGPTARSVCPRALHWNIPHILFSAVAVLAILIGVYFLLR